MPFSWPVVCLMSSDDHAAAARAGRSAPSASAASFWSSAWRACASLQLVALGVGAVGVPTSPISEGEEKQTVAIRRPSRRRGVADPRLKLQPMPRGHESRIGLSPSHLGEVIVRGSSASTVGRPSLWIAPPVEPPPDWHETGMAQPVPALGNDTCSILIGPRRRSNQPLVPSRIWYPEFPRRADQHRPKRADDEERTERHVRSPADPPRREKRDQHDAAQDEREDDAPERTFAPGQEPDTGEELDVTEPESAGPEWDRRQIQGGRDDDGREHGAGRCPDRRTGCCQSARRRGRPG